MEKWLGEKNSVDMLSHSVANNVTSEMGLELLDVADVVRQYSAVIEYFHHASEETFFEDLSRLEGGNVVRDSIRSYLVKYGMRCSREFDITRPRWNIGIIFSRQDLTFRGHRKRYENNQRRSENPGKRNGRVCRNPVAGISNDFSRLARSTQDYSIL